MNIISIARKMYSHLYEGTNYVINPYYLCCNSSQMIIFCNDDKIQFWSTPFGQLTQLNHHMGEYRPLIEEYKTQKYDVKDVTNTVKILTQFNHQESNTIDFNACKTIQNVHYQALVNTKIKYDTQVIQNIFAITEKPTKSEIYVTLYAKLSNEEYYKIKENAYKELDMN